MRKVLTVMAAASVLLVAAPAGAQPALRLPVGEQDGVRLVRGKSGALVVVFTPRAERLWRRVAGRRVDVSCTERVDDEGFFRSTNGGSNVVRAPKHGHRVWTGDRTRRWDYCRIWLEPRRIKRHGRVVRTGRALLVSIPLTQNGAAYLDGQSSASALLEVLVTAELMAERRGQKTYPSPARLVARVPHLPRPSALRVAPLAGPSDTPPSGAVGYYSDGGRAAEAVVLSASGRRLFLGVQSDVVYSNVNLYVEDPELEGKVAWPLGPSSAK